MFYSVSEILSLVFFPREISFNPRKNSQHSSSTETLIKFSLMNWKFMSVFSPSDNDIQ